MRLTVGVAAWCLPSSHGQASLLSKGVLREDLPGRLLLTRENVDDDALLKLSRLVATVIGVPPATPFCVHHPAKLFDFSTRARCLTPFKVLAQATRGGADGGARVVALDLSAQPFLASCESEWLQSNADDATSEVMAKKEQIEALQAEILETAAQARVKATQLAEAANVTLSAEDLDGAAIAATTVGVQRREALLRQLAEAGEKLGTARQALARWREQLGDAEGTTAHIPVFPIGDSLLEPFVRAASPHTSPAPTRRQPTRRPAAPAPCKPPRRRQPPCAASSRARSPPRRARARTNLTIDTHHSSPSSPFPGPLQPVRCVSSAPASAARRPLPLRGWRVGVCARSGPRDWAPTADSTARSTPPTRSRCYAPMAWGRRCSIGSSRTT